jgi:uroporphyrinogen decarboxylase
MTSKERILTAVNHQPVDRMPTDMWATSEVQEMLYDHFDIKVGKETQSDTIGLLGGYLSRGVEALIELWDKLNIDGIIDIRPPYMGDKRVKRDGLLYTEWGFGYKKIGYGRGVYLEQVIFPLEKVTTIQELEDFSWPNPDDYDYSALPSIIEKCGERAVSCGYHALFTFHQYLRGLELNLVDPMMDPDFTKVLIKKISDFFIEYHGRCFEAAKGKIDFTQVTDDWGSQTGLLSDISIFDEFYRSEMQQGIDLAHAHNIKVLHHNDGDCRPLLPRLVEMGIDILNPIQWSCGNWDLAELKEKYGKDICFHSAVDNQNTLPFGSPEDVRKEAKNLIETLGSDRTGFILGPCHNLQSNTSVENILALYDANRSNF